MFSSTLTLLPFILTVNINASVPTALDALIQRLDQIRQQEHIAGVGLVIASADRTIWSGALGITDWTSGRPMDDTTYVRIGSITKAMTALVFLRLADQGRLSLNAKIAELVDSTPYTNPWQKAYPITIAHALEHSAGLTDLLQQEWDHNVPLALSAALAIAPASRQLRWPAGLHSSYSNSGAGIAAYAMQQATGLDFEAYALAEVFRPLGMSSASFALNDTVQADLATGYNRDGRTEIPYWHTLYRPFGGVNVRIRDMAPFIRMLLARGQSGKTRFLPAAAIERMETPQTTLAARSGLTFGYGLGNYASVHRGFVLHGHGGDADGYLSRFGYSLDSGLGYFIVINAFRGATLSKLRLAVEDYLVRNLTAHYQPGQPQAKENLLALTGHYQAVTWRFPTRPSQTELEILLDDGRLYLVLGKRKQHLIPMSRYHFRRPFEPVATTAFITHQGELFLQGPFGNFQRTKTPSTQ